MIMKILANFLINNDLIPKRTVKKYSGWTIKNKSRFAVHGFLTSNINFPYVLKRPRGAVLCVINYLKQTIKKAVKNGLNFGYITGFVILNERDLNSLG